MGITMYVESMIVMCGAKSRVKISKNGERRMSKDTIYRQDAIDACIRVQEHHAYDEIEEIKALPPADVQTVVHGEWYKPTGMMPPEYTGRHRCSLCDGFAMHEWKHHREVLTDYCPNCGAKMDK